MKAIETKFVGPGHRKAAEALRDKMGWNGQLIGGSLKKTDVWVFSDVTEAAIAAYRYADFSSCPEVAQMLKDAFRREGISPEPATEGKE